MRFKKTGYTSTTAPFDIIGKTTGKKVTSEGQEKAHTIIIPGPESIM